MSESSSGGCNCSCIGLTIVLFFFWALWFGVPIPGGKKINIDIFPPKIWDMNEKGVK